jgi:hypothetical protein
MSLVASVQQSNVSGILSLSLSLCVQGLMWEVKHVDLTKRSFCRPGAGQQAKKFDGVKQLPIRLLTTVIVA